MGTLYVRNCEVWELYMSGTVSEVWELYMSGTVRYGNFICGGNIGCECRFEISWCVLNH